MIYHFNKDLKEWCNKHELEVVDVKCGHCKKDIRTTIPCETSQTYGLIGPSDCCDNPKPGFTFVFKNKTEFSEMFSNLKNNLEKG